MSSKQNYCDSFYACVDPAPSRGRRALLPTLRRVAMATDRKSNTPYNFNPGYFHRNVKSSSFRGGRGARGGGGVPERFAKKFGTLIKPWGENKLYILRSCMGGSPSSPPPGQDFPRLVGNYFSKKFPSIPRCQIKVNRALSIIIRFLSRLILAAKAERSVNIYGKRPRTVATAADYTTGLPATFDDNDCCLHYYYILNSVDRPEAGDPPSKIGNPI